MLERAAACLEPKTQLLTRYIEPPIRSARALGPSFWHNAGDQKNVPLWWPSYLETIRSSSRKHDSIRSRTITSKLAETSFTSNSTPSPSAPNLASHQRLYTQSVPSQQLPRYVEVPNDEFDGIYTIPPSAGERVPRRPSSPTQSNTITDIQPPDGPLSHDSAGIRAKALQNLLDQGSDPTERNYSQAWNLLISLENQQSYASSILNYLSTSTEPRDLEHALQAFSFIDSENRSQADYETVIRVAVHRRQYNHALRACEEASKKNLAQNCRQILLLGCLSHGLWKTAARAWSSFFQPSWSEAIKMGERLNIIERDPRFPVYLSHLCQELLSENATSRYDRQPLRAMVHTLSLQALSNHRVLGVTAGQAILHLFHQLKELSLLESHLYMVALRTLASVEMPYRRADLAVEIYQHMISVYPYQTVYENLFCSLIILCDRAKHDPQVFDYWLEEIKRQHPIPSISVYRSLMWALAHHGDVCGTQHLFNQMESEHGKPTTLRLIHPLLYAHATRGDFKAVEASVKQAEKSYGLQADLHSWTLVFFAYSRSDVPRSALSAFDRMLKTPVRPDIVTFETLIGICSRLGDTRTALALVDIASGHGIELTGDAIAMIVHAYCEAGQPKEGERLASESVKMKLKKNSTRIWDNLLRHYAFQADFAAIRRVHNNMRALSIKSGSATNATILTSLVRVRKTADALGLLRYLDSIGDIGEGLHHFSIILHGFTMERNYTMAKLVGQEMEHRFRSIGSSAQLANFQARVRRIWRDHAGEGIASSERKQNEAQQVASFVHEIMSQTSSAIRVTSDPQPGFGRLRPYDAVESIFADYSVEYLASHGMPVQAQQLDNRIQSARARKHGHGSKQESISTLVARMKVASSLIQWTAVDAIWYEILQRNVQSTATTNIWPSLTIAKSSLINSNTMMDQIRSAMKRSGAEIFYVQKFAVSRPLRLYMEALCQQRRQDDLILLIKDLYQIGFALTNKDWNKYIQVLCQSPETHHHMLAFEVFEKLQFRRSLPWMILMRSSRSNRRESIPISPETIKITSEKLRVVPTFLTFMHLGAVVLDYRRKSVLGDDTNIRELYQAYPKLVWGLNTIPLIRTKAVRDMLVGQKSGRHYPGQFDHDASITQALFQMKQIALSPTWNPESPTESTTKMGRITSAAVFEGNNARSTNASDRPGTNEDHTPHEKGPVLPKRVDEQRKNLLTRMTGEIAKEDHNTSTEVDLFTAQEHDQSADFNGQHHISPLIESNDLEKQILELRQRRRASGIYRRQPFRPAAVMEKWQNFVQREKEFHGRVSGGRRILRPPPTFAEQRFRTRKQMAEQPQASRILAALKEWSPELVEEADSEAADATYAAIPSTGHKDLWNQGTEIGDDNDHVKWKGETETDNLIETLLPQYAPVEGDWKWEKAFARKKTKEESAPVVQPVDLLGEQDVKVLGDQLPNLPPGGHSEQQVQLPEAMTVDILDAVAALSQTAEPQSEAPGISKQTEQEKDQASSQASARASDQLNDKEKPKDTATGSLKFKDKINEKEKSNTVQQNDLWSWPEGGDGFTL